jgi:hypothetical protein
MVIQDFQFHVDSFRLHVGPPLRTVGITQPSAWQRGLLVRRQRRRSCRGSSALFVSVFLYYSRPLTASSDTSVAVSFIPAFGIRNEFKGGPPRDSGVPSYFLQMMAHLAVEAEQCDDREKAIGLFVDSDNARAVGAWQKVGFTEFPPHEVSGTKTYLRLMVPIAELLRRLQSS